MYKIMEKLIGGRFYKTKAEAQEKCDVFYAVGRLTSDQYKNLTSLIVKIYN